MSQIIYIYRYNYFSLLMTFILGLVALIIGLFNRLVFATILGGTFLVASFYYFIRYSRYKLILKKGSLVEYSLGSKQNIEFDSIETLDCQITKGWMSLTILPILIVLKDNGEKVKFTLKDQASIVDIMEWIKTNYPTCHFSEKVNEVLSWKHYSLSSFNLFFKSKKLLL